MNIRKTEGSTIAHDSRKTNIENAQKNQATRTCEVEESDMDKYEK